MPRSLSLAGILDGDFDHHVTNLIAALIAKSGQAILAPMLAAML